ncbi:MAG: glycosyltransferase [Alphaproteobacteria bacterium]|nr:glycosyltransferase [Alphaproteobacteria bacterium]
MAAIADPEVGPAKPTATQEPRPDSAPTERRAVFVLGMHRSGTSAVTRVLNLLGVELGHGMMAASPDNERGYWEHMAIVQEHHQLLEALGSSWDDVRALPANWMKTPAAASTTHRLRTIVEREFAAAPLWGLKDPRLCRLLPLWLPLLRALRITPHFVLVLRHPAEVAASLAKRDRKSNAAAALLWLRHMLEAERATRGLPRTIVNYADLIENPRDWTTEFNRVAAECGLRWSNAYHAVDEAVAAFLSPGLRHHQIAEKSDGDVCGAWVQSVYDALRTPKCQTGECDRVAAEIERADEVWGRLAGVSADAQRGLSPEAMHDEITRLEHVSAELRDAVSRKDMELRELQASVRKYGRGPLATLTAADAYAKWMEGFAKTATGRADWVAERVAQWPQLPRFVFGMVVPEGIESNVALTVASLQALTVGDWRLFVVGEGPAPAGIAADQRIVWQVAADERPVVTLNRLLRDAAADWIGLIDAGDQLAPHALFALADAGFRHADWSAIYSDEDRIDGKGQCSNPQFKPDFNIDLMRSMPYVGGLLVVRPAEFAALGGFDAERDGLEEYDLALRVAERLGAKGFGHVADVLYHRLAGSGRTRRPIQEIIAEGPRTVAAHLQRLGFDATVESGAVPTQFRVRYRHAGPEPLVSIIIPTRDRLHLLKECIETLLGKTSYANYEVIIIDNDSTARDAREYLDLIEARRGEIGSRLRVIRHPGPFNFSAMNNRAVRNEARGDYVCLLNNDTTVFEPEWLSEMMMHARRPDVGVVGAKLYFPNQTIQHGGVIMGVGWGAPAEHPYIGQPENAPGYWGRLTAVQDFSAVTGACLVTRRALYDELGGLDADALHDNFQDIDYCLKVRRAGYRVVWTPYARLMHESGVSRRDRARKEPTADQLARLKRERDTMYDRWMPVIAFDPAYNPNLSSVGTGFDIEADRMRCWNPEFRPRPRVIAHAADRDACGEYRIIAPSRVLFDAGVLHACETMRLMMPPEYARIAPDTVVFQRQIEDHQIEKIEEIKRHSRAFRVFELDDLLTNLPLKSIHRPNIPRDVGQRLRRALAACDRLVVSTEPLAQAYGAMCDQVVVLPNRLERSHWQGLREQPRTEGRPRVGWAGALGHLGDLEMMASVVEETAKEVDWVFFGMCPDALRPFVKEFHDWVPIPEYPAKLASLGIDLGVAPLEFNPFNEAKSNLRLLEYGVLGIPVICTDIVPYQGNLPVRRVKNRHRDWVKAIREVAADRAACRREGEALRQAVLADWMLDQHLDDWRKAWLR